MSEAPEKRLHLNLFSEHNVEVVISVPKIHPLKFPPTFETVQNFFFPVHLHSIDR